MDTIFKPMRDLDFLLSLSPRQVAKFVTLNNNEDLLFGIIHEDELYKLYVLIEKENYRGEFKWNDHVWLFQREFKMKENE